MPFVDRSELQSPALQALAGWYEALAVRSDSWPPREAFRAETMPPSVLPHAARVDVERDPLRIYYRAAGSVISESVGVEVTGHYLDELDVPHIEGVTEWYRLALAAPGPLFARDSQTIDGTSFVYEGCCLPLGDPADDPRAFVIGEDFLDIEVWRKVLRNRRYDKPA